MTDAKETASERITNILSALQTRIYKDIEKIRAIALAEQERYDDDSEESTQWYAFGGEQMMSDIFRAEQAMSWQLSALFGQMALRQLNRDKGQITATNDANGEATDRLE